MTIYHYVSDKAALSTGSLSSCSRGAIPSPTGVWHDDLREIASASRAALVAPPSPRCHDAATSVQ
jgi:hypothetical protein